MLCRLVALPRSLMNAESGGEWDGWFMGVKRQWRSQCDLQSSISLAWKLVRNAGSQSPPRRPGSNSLQVEFSGHVKQDSQVVLMLAQVRSAEVEITGRTRRKAVLFRER